MHYRFHMFVIRYNLQSSNCCLVNNNKNYCPEYPRMYARMARRTILPEAKDKGVSGHPRRRGAITFNITQPTIIPFITQHTIYRVIVYALPCHG